jgi:hypothetical protein
MKMATKKSTSTAVAKWDEELARQAAAAAAVEESTATGTFFSLKSGILSFNDAPVPGNEMAVIILDGILENVYYEGDYDSDNPQGPKCFAFGREEKEMTPHTIVIESQNNIADKCTGCEMNEWGSADKGRGKACRNSRRLAMIPAGHFDDKGKFSVLDDDAFESSAIGFMKLPVTSVKGYAAFVKQVSGALKRPPFAVYTKVKVVPDPSSQFKVLFEPISQVPDELLGTIFGRVEEAKLSIDAPYSAFEEQEAPAPRRGAKAAAPRGKAAAPARGKRY